MYNRPLKRHRRPRRIPNTTYRMDAGHSRFYITVGHIKKGKPYEVFITPALGERNSKPNLCEKAWAESLARSISLGLQYGVPAEDYIRQLRGIICVPGADPERNRMIKSPADGIAVILQDYMNSNNKGDSHDPS